MRGIQTIGAPRRCYGSIGGNSLTRTIAPTGVKKRGWPKGKPRKGPNALATKGKKKGKGKQPKFPFMKLPLELRRNIYSLVLPQQEVQSGSSGWATMAGNSNKFMNLLLVNKQVSEEARSVLYGLNTFTMIISGDRTLLLGSFAETNHMPFQTKPSLPFIKNWQIALWPNESYMLDRADAHHYDALLSACSEIAKTPGLQTLKLSIPCLCLQPGTGVCKCSNRVNGECHCLDEEDIGDLHDMFLNILIPFDQLRFEGKVQLGATHKPAEQLWSNKHLARPSRFPRSENKHGYIQLSKYPHQKCQDPRCVSFAASFGPAMATLMGKTTPNILTKDQLEWLDLKKRVAETMNYHRRGGNGVPEPNISLNDLWDALDSGESEYFAKEKRRVYEQLRAHAFHTDSRYYLLSGRAGWR